MSSRIRVLSYAINGRGMGHLVRQLAILRQVRRLCSLLDVRAECWVLTSSEADTLARREGFPAIKLPSKAMLRDGGLDPHVFLGALRSTVLQAVTSLRPDLLLVDTFPGGSVGELVPVLELVPHRVLVARRVRDAFAAEDGYQALAPLYQRQIQPDDRGSGPILVRDRAELRDRAAARTALGIGDQRAVYLSLGGGGDLAAPQALPRLARTLLGAGWHVVVGAGPLYMGEELRGPGITWLSRYLPLELLPGVDAAVSAAGYNSFHELMFAGVPTVFLPQPRIADDQLERARRAEAAGAGRVAERFEDVVALLDDPGSPDAARALVPRNGALDAAVQALTGLLPDADLAAARKTLTPSLLAALQQLRPPGRPPGDELSHAMELLRLLTDGPPSERARRAEWRQEIRDAGGQVPDEDALDADQALQRFFAVCKQHGLPLEHALALTRDLHRKFPAARGPQLLSACEQLFAVWAPFDDWMGAVSLLRAVPIQRSLRLDHFVDDLGAWLRTQDDLFDALRDFTRLEGRGQRPVAEVLRQLGSRRAG